MTELLSPTLKDEELVRESIKDPGSYGFLMERYADKLSRYIYRLARLSEDDAKDILQESFIKAYQNLNDFDQTLKFSSWIYRIVHNQTISFLRKKKPTISIAPYTEGEETTGILEDLKADTDIELETEAKINGEKLKKELGTLEEKYRSILILRYMEEKDYKEISDILKIPIGTVGTLMSRAKKKLAEKIKAK